MDWLLFWTILAQVAIASGAFALLSMVISFGVRFIFIGSGLVRDKAKITDGRSDSLLFGGASRD